MANGTDEDLRPSITALPPLTVRQIGSHQLLTDPSSVVKELIDNALDARAKSIFVDIAANTIDCVQVKDDGHGISSEDRALACRRYCTSKIRDFHDLKQVGGKWLGFRGEALASIADMSSTLIITTRVEGEPVAVKLAYRRNGELISTERDSHPVGTTVKITKLLESAKVRRDLALKGSARCLAKIKHIMQAYALARPAVRFRLHVLKAKNNKGDFIYAPKTNANMEDAALKIIGKECALQCEWTALEWEGLELHAFLPKPTALGSKVANHGAFISVDYRPVSPTRGTIKKIALVTRDRMRNASLTLAHVKDPFFTLNIICPVDSYDPNIEPAKDDVIFADESTVLAAVNRLLISYYPGSSVRTNSVAESDFDNNPSTQPNDFINVTKPLLQHEIPRPIRSDELIEDPDISDAVAPSVIPRWRSTMYGVDEEDLDFLPSNAQVAVDGEEDYRDIDISNPWTIARMNAPVKPKKTIGNEQLLSPVKSQRDPLSAPGSPSSVATPRQSMPVEPHTPRTDLRGDQCKERPDVALQPVSPRLAQCTLPEAATQEQGPVLRTGLVHGANPPNERLFPGFGQSRIRNCESEAPFVGTAAPRHDPRSPRPLRTKSYIPPVPCADDTWFGQPMRNVPKPIRPPKRYRHRESAFFPHGDSSRIHMPSGAQTTRPLREDRAIPKGAANIGGLYRQPWRPPTNLGISHPPRSGQSQYPLGQSRPYNERGDSTQSLPLRPHSADAHSRPLDQAQEMEALFRFHESVGPSQKSILSQSSDRIDSKSAAELISRPQRPRTADGDLYRTKSSNLPLNAIPHSSETHRLSLLVKISVPSLVRQARKLDMTINSLEWGYDCTDAFDTFASPISERTIMDWVAKIDNMLHGTYERIDGIEVRGALREGVQRFIDRRRDEDEASHAYAVTTMATKIPNTNSRSTASQDSDCKSHVPAFVISHDKPNCPTQSEEWSGRLAAAPVDVKRVTSPTDYDQDFGFEQFVDLNGNVGGPISPVRSVKMEDKFADDIGDDMLLDL